jgi:hypothetical protein
MRELILDFPGTRIDSLFLSRIESMIQELKIKEKAQRGILSEDDTWCMGMLYEYAHRVEDYILQYSYDTKLQRRY